MATLERLRRELPGLIPEYFRQCRAAEENRPAEYAAAVVIQSWFRGCRVRAYLRYLNRMVTVIQKWWRGYLARKYFRKKVKTAYFIMKMNFYNDMAVRIQKMWWGYYVRKYVHNYYALKRYLEGVAIKNSLVRKELEEYATMKEKEKLRRYLEKEEHRKNHEARKMHYLLSTEQVASVFNSPYRQYPDEMEFRLQRARPLSHRDLSKKSNDSDGFVDWSDCRHPFTFPTASLLPPINKKKPQGPFRDVGEVLQQRYRPLEPTLRVATSFTSVEEARKVIKWQEWTKGFQDDIFSPFASLHKNKPYEPLIHTSTEYKRIPYGSQHFRGEEPAKWVAKKDFQATFTPIPLFNKYGRMYSKTGQAV
ncbi:PREDICTED: spermatogenesis-associated protein 17 [Nanorana parkeri]|uniref:spermatogenesis-associated protein 17 n=1 Tax=Nanorana parkeri TaxID=125878 RepID=UPI0008550286|nr:PREDICTED: spermatogenesis-associated protein 17 [Nanorana parkeri]